MPVTYHLRALICAWLILCGVLTHAQGKQGITFNGKLENAGIDQLAGFLHAATGYRIYYDQTKFDSLRVNLEFSEKNVDWVLSQAFLNTKYRYAIDFQKNVFLTAGDEIVVMNEGKR